MHSLQRHSKRDAHQQLYVQPGTGLPAHPRTKGSPPGCGGIGGSSRSLDDDKVGYLVNTDKEKADGNEQQGRSPSNNVWRIVLGIAVHTFPFLLYKVFEVVGHTKEARQDAHGYEYQLSARTTLVGLGLGFRHLSIYLSFNRGHTPTDGPTTEQQTNTLSHNGH